MSTSRAAPGGPNRSPICGAGSIASSCQSPSPTALSEKRPSLGGVTRARATLILARSLPNHGLSRAPFTGLRVVATSRVGLVESSAASGPGPADNSDAQPPSGAPSVSADAAEANPRNTARRDGAVLRAFTSRRDNMRLVPTDRAC